MAPLIRRPSQVSQLLWLIGALACASGWSTCRAAIPGAGNRKLLQGSGLSTPFGEPAPGTLVVTWSAVPAKYSPGLGSVNPPHPPPYQYDWFNLYNPGSENVSLQFYPTNAYVVGPGNQKMELTSSGGCDVVTTDYPDEMSVIDSCRGNFTVPAGCPAVSAVYMLLQAPAGLEFQIPTPFDGFNCTAPLFTNTDGTYAQGSFEAVFEPRDSPVPLTDASLYSFPITFTILSLSSQPFTSTGTLAFQSINMRVEYDPPVPLPEGPSLSWSIPYPYCYFASKEVTVQSVTTGEAPTSEPTPRTLVPPSTQCPSVDGFYTNSCFNTRGTMHVCCINPDSCGPFTANGNPTCTNGQYYSFN